MKKILSLTLAIMMLVSAIPTAHAAVDGITDYTNGTQVEYIGTGSEQYTVTVPAKMAPSDTGDVLLEGTWASNRIVTVTADENIVLTNSINAADTKTLAVNFSGISLAGNNTKTVRGNKPFTLGKITNALFGTWSGVINYTVSINDKN